MTCVIESFLVTSKSLVVLSVIGGDTDSVFCKISNIDMYNRLHPAMARDGLLDASNFPRTHAHFSNRYKAVLGCIKDELPGAVVKEAVLLKPKCYSINSSRLGKENCQGS